MLAESKATEDARASADTPHLRVEDCASSAPENESIDAAEKGQQKEEAKPVDVDPDLVTWTGVDDPENPHNFSVRRRVFVTAVWVYGNIVTTLASSIFASGASLIETEFDVSATVATLGVSLFVVVGSHFLSSPLNPILALLESPMYQDSCVC